MRTLSLTNKTQHEIPDAVILGLNRAQHRLHYTPVRDVFYIVWTWGEIVGVFGDGDNGAYEWFRLSDNGKKFETSDNGWGNPHGPLRVVLNLVHKAEGDDPDPT